MQRYTIAGIGIFWEEPMSLVDRTFKWLLLFLVAGGVAAVAIVSAQNPTLVAFQYIVWKSLPVPLGLILSLILAGGLFLGGFIPLGTKKL
jgi:uncharacterized integral membrane protein